MVDPIPYCDEQDALEPVLKAVSKKHTLPDTTEMNADITKMEIDVVEEKADTKEVANNASKMETDKPKWIIDECDKPPDPEPEEKRIDFSLKLKKLDTVCCLVCAKSFITEEQRFEHLLDEHFENTGYLSRRCNLVSWLLNFTKRKSNSQNNDENVNICASNMSGGSLSTENVFNTPNTLCTVCNERLLTTELLSIHSMGHMQLRIPKLSSDTLCSACDKYFINEDACCAHIFGKHFTNANTPCNQKQMEVMEFISQFFNTAVGTTLLEKYKRYSVNFSPLLDRILGYEQSKLITCRYCKERKSSLLDLYNHYNELHSSLPATTGICVLCNFLPADVVLLVSHYFQRHIRCYCGYVGEDFQTYRLHASECKPEVNGIVCPICTNERFICEQSFKDHIQEIGRKSCFILRRNKWVCLLCKVQCSKENMYDHIFLEHVNCHCTFKSKDFQSFCEHLGKCSLLRSGVLCPICRNVKLRSVELFGEHLTMCLPWKETCKKVVRGNKILFSDLQNFLNPEDTVKIIISKTELKKKRAKLAIGRDYM